MADYRRYLAASIISEDKVVTYRVLSRALKINVNAAKEMLYEFHRQQNAKQPGTIQATYLLSGIKSQPDRIADIKKDGEDDYMQSSPFMSSMPQPEDTGSSSTLTITLVREDDLESVKGTYEVINSIHIYSLAPHPLKDIQILSDSMRELLTLTANDDPLETLQTYGTITNPLCKRRPNRRPPPAAVKAVPPPVFKKVEPTASAKVKEEPTPAQKQEGKGIQSQAAKDFFAKGKEKDKGPGSGASSKESTPAPPANLKRENSSLFKSFAKAKPKKIASEDASIQGMAMDADDDDDDEEDHIVPAPKKKRLSNGDDEEDVVEAEESRKSRKAREEELRRMMEDSDEDILPAKDEEPEEEPPVVIAKPEPIREEEPLVTVSGGRRRGKRRVMKKKTVKDDEGYLVTKEEAVWESFSEDEPVAKAKPKAPVPTTARGKKAAEKKGQGNIMSFFGKKA